MVQSAVSVGDEMAGSLLSGCVQDTSAARRETAVDSPIPLVCCRDVACQRRCYSLLDCRRQITPTTEQAVRLDVLGIDWPYLMLRAAQYFLRLLLQFLMS